ncbi:MAG: trypsin-like serine protease [Clostridiales bacterium]|nr:trypsin-like serine protease [Clostridiales bacterium]
MRKIIVYCMILLCIIAIGCDVEFANHNDNLQSRIITLSDGSDITSIASAIGPAVVAIHGISEYGESVGSGVCVSENGYILTNSHVVTDCNDIILYLSDKSSVGAKVVYNDPVLDLAILRSERAIPCLRLGDSRDIVVGEDVLAVGTPLSLTLTHTFTKGIVSALDRTIKVSSTEGNGYMQNLIQHDASLNPGNSGGPLINTKGEVIGINTLKISGGEGIGFAIPTRSFESLLSSFVTNVNYKVPYLGVYGYDSEIAKYYGKSDIGQGFYIIDIASNSPLKDINISPSAVITQINGVDVSNTLDLKNELYRLSANDSVSIEYYMGGEYFSTKTKLQKS